MTEQSQQVAIVVGAGIIGASIAWHLTRSGIRVTVIESGTVGGVATPCSFGWVNATYGFPRPYFDLRLKAMSAWDALAAARPGLPYQQTGTVYLHLDDDDGTPVDLDAFVTSHSAWGYEIQTLTTDEISARAPGISDLPASGAFAPNEASAEGTEIARLFLQDVTDAGGSLITGTPVTGLLEESGRVVGVETALGPIRADEVIVAAGAATSQLIERVAPPVPLKTPPGILLHTTATRPVMPHITLCKDLHIRQLTDGTFLAGCDFGGGTKTLDAASEGQQLLDRIKSLVRDTTDLQIADITVGHRPTPQDGCPVVGRPVNTPGLIVAVMHSGITLAPLVGAAVSHFIESGDMHENLVPYGPDRFETNAAIV